MATFTGTYTNGVILNDPTDYVTAGSSVTNTAASHNGDAIYGSSHPFSLVNAGLITGVGPASAGIRLLAGGAVTSASSGIVSGGTAGVYINAGSGTVTNNGTIRGSTTDSVGIGLLAGGIVNNGSANSNATVYGKVAGVYISGGAGSVRNSGTLVGYFGAGVLLRGGGAVVNGQSGSNLGIIASPAQYSSKDGHAHDAIYVAGSSGNVTNFGTLLGRTGVDLRAGGTVVNEPGASITSTGISLYSGGFTTVDNFGTIKADTIDFFNIVPVVQLKAGGYVTNEKAGLITGSIRTDGIVIGGVGGTVLNSGTIESSAGPGAGGSVSYHMIRLASGTVINTSGALISENSNIGVEIDGPGASVINAGSIHGGRYAITFAQGGTVTNGSANGRAASIDGSNIFGPGTGISIGGENAVVNNFGTVSGGRPIQLTGRSLTLVNYGVINVPSGFMGTNAAAVSVLSSTLGKH